MRGRKGAVIATIAAGLLWGSSFVVVKIGLSDLNPYWFVFLRFSTAALVALVAASLAKKGRETLRLLRHPLVLWLGVTNAAGFVLQFRGQTLTTAGKAALLVNANTIFVAVASWFVLHERLGRAKTLGVAVGMAGVCLVTTGGRAAVVGDGGTVVSQQDFAISGTLVAPVFGQDFHVTQSIIAPAVLTIPSMQNDRAPPRCHNTIG
jgi:drug/metabolite transporter (DMT)-like permease